MTDPLKSAEEIAKTITSRFSNENYQNDRWLSGNPDRLQEQIMEAILAERKRAEGLEKELASCQKRGQRYLEVMKKTAEALNGGPGMYQNTCMGCGESFGDPCKKDCVRVCLLAALSTEEDGVCGT